MEFRYQYHGTTQVDDSARSQAFQFAPDLLRPQVAFDAVLRADSGAHWPVREALSALHDVVVSDLRIRGRDQTAYKAWLADNEEQMLTQFMQRSATVQAKLAEVRKQWQDVRQQPGACSPARQRLPVPRSYHPDCQSPFLPPRP